MEGPKRPHGKTFKIEERPDQGAQDHRLPLAEGNLVTESARSREAGAWVGHLILEDLPFIQVGEEPEQEALGGEVRVVLEELLPKISTRLELEPAGLLV